MQSAFEESEEKTVSLSHPQTLLLWQLPPFISPSSCSSHPFCRSCWSCRDQVTAGCYTQTLVLHLHVMWPLCAMLILPGTRPVDCRTQESSGPFARLLIGLDSFALTSSLLVILSYTVTLKSYMLRTPSLHSQPLQIHILAPCLKDISV